MTAEHELMKLLKVLRVSHRVQGTSVPFWELRRPNAQGGTDLIAKIYDRQMSELLQVVCYDQTQPNRL